MCDYPVHSIGDVTALEYADTPNLDRLCSKGRCGLLQTIPEGMKPGSEIANATILGIDAVLIDGRAPLEAAGMGLELEDNCLYLRCNLISTENGIIRSATAEHISDEEAGPIIDLLNEELSSEGIEFHRGLQYRHIAILRGGSKQIECEAPHEHIGQKEDVLEIRATSEEGKNTALLLNRIRKKAASILKGKKANAIALWSAGYRPSIPAIDSLYPTIRSGAVISAVDLIRGLGIAAGLEPIRVEGANGLYNTNYEGKALAAINALKTKDFVFLHLEGPDEASHEGKLDEKIKAIEAIDSRIVAPIAKAFENENLAIAVMADHYSPVSKKVHTCENVAFFIYSPAIKADNVGRYSERHCKSGSYGVLRGGEFMKEFMSLD